MNEKQQVVILLTIVLALVAGIFLHRVEHLESRVSSLIIESDSRELNTTVQSLQTYSFATYKERIKNLLNSSPPIIEALADKDRERLYQYAKIKYDSLQRENPFFHIMQFHLPDGTLFLQIQQPDSSGDSAASESPMVAAVLQDQTALSGFEFGEEGLFFRVVQPVFLAGIHVGALELGIKAQEVVAAIEENLHEKIISYYLADQWQKARLLQGQQVTQRGRFVLKSDNAPWVAALPQEFWEERHYSVVKQGGRSFRVHNHPIFKNFKGESFGGIIFLQDITAALQEKQAFFWKAALATLLLFLVATAVLYFTLERILARLVKEIAARKQAEIEVQERETHIRLLLDSAAEGIFGLDNEGKCTFVNRSCLKLLGYDHEEDLLGATLHDLIHYRRIDGTDFPKAECPMCLSYHGGQQVKVDDEVLWCKDGRAIPVKYNAYPIKDKGRLLGSVVSFTDISRRKHAEDDKERLAAAIWHAADEVIITNLDGVIEYVNPAFEQVSGFTREDALGNKPSVLKSGKHSQEFYDDLWGTISKGRVWSNRIINKTKGGALLEEDATISPIFDPSGRPIGYVAVKRDVTEKVRMEERLRQVNKMESLGTLAGAIAHDFNNILNGINGFISLSLAEVPVPSRVASNLHEVKRAAAMATDLVRQILAFSRKGSSEFKAVAIQDVAIDVIALLRCTLPKTITIDAQLDKECRSVWGNVSQIHQVIMNLGINACHALAEQGGEMSVSLREREVEPPDGGGEINRFVQLTISDTGTGIAPEDVGHIFEPGFTTKKEGEGTGLGLATVNDIVKSHHGHIEVSNEPGQGTTFTLSFPVWEKTYSAAEESGHSQVLPELRGHVLFVDDTAINVMLGREILQTAGCQVTAFSDSAKALALFRQQPQLFDLVVTDHIMPGLTGLELAREMIKIRADIPIVMVSGGGDTLVDEALRQGVIKEFLVKPISVQGLLAVAARGMEPSLLSRRLAVQLGRADNMYTSVQPAGEEVLM